VGLYFGLEARHRACDPFPCVHFHWKLKPSGVSLESPGQENISQVWANRAIVAQNHNARKTVLATISVLKWSGAIFRPRSWKLSVRSFYLCSLHRKLTPSRVIFESPRLENISQVPGNRAKVAQNYDSRKAVSATFSVLKCSGAIYRPRSWKLSVRSFYLCSLHRKLTPWRVILESPRLENISQVPGNRAKVAQNYELRKAVSATFSVLKCSGAIFRPRSLTPSVRPFYLSPFHWKLRASGVSLESPGLENIPKFREIEPRLLKMTMRVRGSRLLIQS